MKDSILVSLFALNSTHVSTIKLVISTHLYEIQVETFIIAIFELNWNEIFEELIDWNFAYATGRYFCQNAFVSLPYLFDSDRFLRSVYICKKNIFNRFKACGIKKKYCPTLRHDFITPFALNKTVTCLFHSISHHKKFKLEKTLSFIRNLDH